MGAKRWGGHQTSSFKQAKDAAAEVRERVEFPVVTLGSGNYAKLLERGGNVPRVVMMVHFDPGEEGEAKAAAVIEGARWRTSSLSSGLR